MTLKERIKKLADAQGLSLPALEAKLGFGNSTIVKWDKSTPNAEKLNTVAQFFGVSMDYLMTGKEPSASSAATQEASSQLTAYGLKDNEDFLLTKFETSHIKNTVHWISTVKTWWTRFWTKNTIAASPCLIRLGRSI